MPLESITSLLTQKIGLDPQSLGANVVTRVVARCMAECGVEDAHAYRQRLEVSPEIWERLVEAVVVPETWFFRDGKPFVVLGDQVLPQWLSTWNQSTASRAGECDPVFRVLSAPCATGEEPYSIAMTLLDRGLAPERFQIDAVDISAKALEIGGRAVFGKMSFRGGTDLGYRDRYFQETCNGYQLTPQVRQQVRFFRANLLEKGLPVDGIRYDAVFCRNLLIYFDAAARDRTLHILRRLLATGGVLFAGHAEAMTVLQSGFVSTDDPGAFAFRVGSSAAYSELFAPQASSKSARADGQISARRKVTPTGTRPRSSARGDGSPRLPSLPTAPSPAQATITPASAPSTEEARRLADAGRLDEAIALCEQLVAQKQASAECFCLLGLIAEAAGDWTKAEQSFDKALYMDPEHEEALVHLALILDRRGESGRATAMRARVRRVEQGRATNIEQVRP